MRPILALLFLAFSLATGPAVAQAAIQRCIGPGGNPVFTDQPCWSLNAAPLVRAPQPMRSAADAPAPPPAVTCAADVAALKGAVIAAFADHDANRMAGLMLWGGYGHGAVVADIQALQRIMREPLLDLGPAGQSATDHATSDDVHTAESEPFGAAVSAASSTAGAPATNNTLVLHTSASDGRGQLRELRFTVVRRSGCVWLRSAD